MGHFERLCDTLRAELRKPKKPRVKLLLKARIKPDEQPKPATPKDKAELRQLLDDAVIRGKLSGTDATAIMHQIGSGERLPDDLNILLLRAFGGQH